MHHQNPPSLSAQPLGCFPKERTMLKCAGRFLYIRLMTTTPTPFTGPYKNIDDLVQLLRTMKNSANIYL